MQHATLNVSLRRSKNQLEASRGSVFIVHSSICPFIHLSVHPFVHPFVRYRRDDDRTIDGHDPAGSALPTSPLKIRGGPIIVRGWGRPRRPQARRLQDVRRADVGYAMGLWWGRQGAGWHWRGTWLPVRIRLKLESSSSSSLARRRTSPLGTNTSPSPRHVVDPDS